jgi:MFS transporter, ACS family, tartrate transporter
LVVKCFRHGRVLRLCGTFASSPRRSPLFTIRHEVSALESSRDPTVSAVPDNSAAVAASAQRKASLRIIPLICVGYGLAYMDRINISFASLEMNRDLGFSATIYGLGAGLFFLGYVLCEVPSNLLLMRFGAKKWLARIMFTWGLLAVGMMFVRNPPTFYVMRFLLGMAEAGFFPGVIYYLTLWFPANMRARAVSRFYIAMPLSSTVMGAVAGWLLGMNDKLGLAGWQWLFLLEGLPAVLFSFVLLWALPDGPSKVSWLTTEEKTWIERTLREDSAQAHLGHGAGAMEALLSPKVWAIGLVMFFLLTCSYGYGFSAPAILQGATGWSVAQVGYVVAIFGVGGAVGMLLGAASSDRARERTFHVIVPALITGSGYLVASYGHGVWTVVVPLGISFCFYHALQGPALSVPMQFLAGRAAAAGIAAMNTITMFSGLVGPYWMGLMKDKTGDYRVGLRGLTVSSICAATMMFVLSRSLKRAPMQQETAVNTPEADGLQIDLEV